MLHIGQHDIEAEVIDHLSQFLHTLFVGRNLGFQVAQIVVEIARRVGCGREQFLQFLFAEPPLIDQLEVVDQNAFSSMCLESGGMEPGVLPPISAWCLMTRRRIDVVTVAVENWRHYGDVRQMRRRYRGR